MKNLFIFSCFIMIFFTANCKQSSAQEQFNNQSQNYTCSELDDLKKQNNNNAPSKMNQSLNQPILLGAGDIIEEESNLKHNIIYYSPDGENYITEIVPQFDDRMDYVDDYIGDNVILYNDMELWREPVYFQAEPPIVADKSLSTVQWLDNKTVMIHGRILYNIITGKTEIFNKSADSMLNYALNKLKDKVACSFIEDEIYKLSLYDFQKKEWQCLFEKKINRIYFFGAKLMWKDNDIIFTTGVEDDTTNNKTIDLAGELDIWRINSRSGKSELLITEATLCGGTGSFIKNRLVYEKCAQKGNEDSICTIGIFDLDRKITIIEMNEYQTNNLFWIIEKGLLGFFDETTNKIKLYSDQACKILGEIDINSIYKDEEILTLTIENSLIKIMVYNQKNNLTKYYKVDISDILY